MSHEEWVIHPKVPVSIAQVIIQAWPFIQKNFKAYPKDIIWIDGNRMYLMLDKNGKLIPKLCNPKHPWNQKNPMPINSIFNDHQVFDIWERKTPGSEKLVHIQTLEDIKKLLHEKNKNDNIILVAYQGPSHKTNKNVHVQTVTCYRLEIQNNGKKIMISKN